MAIVALKFTSKNGSGKSLGKTIIILWISNLQQFLILRIRIADITLNTGPGGDRKYGRKSIDSSSRSKHKDWKNDKKSFDSDRLAGKSIPIFNNS